MPREPSLEQKLDILMSLAADDREGLPPRLRHTRQAGVLRPLNLRVLRPHAGRKVPLLRVLMTNACSLNCRYCPMRRDRDLPRTLLKPDELVRIFLGAHRHGWCEGLFITTGIPGRPVRVMDDLIAVLELLRERHRFRGYIHVKLIPGSEAAQIERLTALASRVSVNLEAPCGASLAAIAPDKNFTTIRADLERVRRLVVAARAEEAAGRPRDPLHPQGVAGMTTQFVVGAAPDTDRQLVDTVADLYATGGIAHAHFSAFRPIRATPLETAQAVPAVREQRLYQTDYLLRSYGFRPDEIVYDQQGNLPLGVDPKVAWALSHPEWFPLEARTAPYEMLVRVPGIGPTAARRIVTERRYVVVRQLRDLRRFGVVTARAAGFLTLGGRRLQTARWTEQLGLWQPEDRAGTYHMMYEVSPGTFR